MPQENSDSPLSESAIALGQLVYTSFQKFGFNLLQSAGTPAQIQQSFVDKVVNARWDPHSPPSSEYRAAYIYQVIGRASHTVFGWLYYDGQDDFGRSGVPYFVAYYWQGKISLEQLQVSLDCLARGPVTSVSRQLSDLNDLEQISLDSALNHAPARRGVDIPAGVLQKSQADLLWGEPIDWFVSQSSGPDSSVPDIQVHDAPVPDIILPEGSDHPSEQVLQLAKPSPSGSLEGPSVGNLEPSGALMPQAKSTDWENISGILRDFVNKTMGIQGIALISEEGQPVASAMGLSNDSIEMLAGSMLYMTQISRQELEWTECNWVTLRGPNNYLMLRGFEPSIYLLIKSAKVPMGLLEGVVKRMTLKLKEELDPYDFIAAMGNRIEDEDLSPSPAAPTPSAAEMSKLLQAVLRNEMPISADDGDDSDDDITYRGRPTSF